MTLVEKTAQQSAASVCRRLVARFPVTLACIALLVATGLANTLELLDGIPFPKEIREAWDSVVSLLFLLIPASLAATLFSEARGWPTQRRLLLSGLAAVLCVLVLGADLKSSLSGAFGLAILVILAPSLRPGLSNQAFWSVSWKVLASIALGLLAALIIGGATEIVYKLVDGLFGVSAPKAIKEFVWNFSLAVVWPFLTLLRMPDVSGAPEPMDVPGWLSFTFNRLLAPAALITVALFLAFAAMTAIQWKLPSRNPADLVFIIAGLGLVVWFVFFPFRDQGSRALRLYQRTFPFALIVLAALPAIVVAARISRFGVEVNLYWELLLSVTIGGIAVYLLAARPPRLIVPPLAIALVLIGGSFGPWGAAAVSLRSQIGEIETLLRENGRLVDGRIVPQDELVTYYVAGDLDSMIKKIRRQGGPEALTEWLAGAGITIDGETEPTEVLERMGIEYDADWRPDERTFFEFNEDDLLHGTLNQLFDVAGYDVIAPLYVDDRAGTYEISAGATHQTYIVTMAGLTIHVARVEDSANGVELNFGRIVESLWDIRTGSSTVVTPDQMTIEAQDNGLRVRFIATNLLSNKIDGVFEVIDGRGLLLIARTQ